jgi:pimeloyl-ACP methyl ester carboxylesterase
MLKTSCALLGALALCVSPLLTVGARAAEVWETFTIPPRLPPAAMEGRVAHDGALIWFATFGSGRPVILVHGDGGESDNFGFQVPALVADGHRVIVIDRRGMGRSTHDLRPLSFERDAEDIIAVMDALSVPRADVVGWSGGGDDGLIMAMKHPDRVSRLFAFGIDADPSGERTDWMSAPIIGPVVTWMKSEYVRVSPTPNEVDGLLNAVATLNATQPHITADELGRIAGPEVAIADGEHEELILPEHTRYIARSIPGAKLIVLPGVSHFAPLQKPDEFNKAVIDFLDGR